MIRRHEQGSVLLETVLILPLFILIIFFIIQITFVWTAKQLTYYAAYCGARAALVYNPQDYGAPKQPDGSWQTPKAIQRGIVHHAACSALAWISWSLDSQNNLNNFIIGNYPVPLSGKIRNQVSVKIREFEKIEAEKKARYPHLNQADEPTPLHQQFPAVTVEVCFKCPLFIPLGGALIAYFFGASDGWEISTENSIGIGGFTATNGDLIQNRLKAQGYYSDTPNAEYYSIPLIEKCTMAKPYKTDTYPLMSQGDKIIMRLRD